MSVEQGRDMLAPTPPMGWNSYDSYGCAINEDQFRANVEALSATLLDAGYEYACIDAGWYHDKVAAHELVAEGLEKPHLDDYGRLIPSPRNFPSARDVDPSRPWPTLFTRRAASSAFTSCAGFPVSPLKKRSPLTGG